MSTPELEKLIDDYLDGHATEAEVQRLDALVRNDPKARRELILASAMHAEIRQVASARQKHAKPRMNRRAGANPAAPKAAWRKSTKALCIAGIGLLVLAGWSMAAIYASRSESSQEQLDAAKRELAGLQLTRAGTAEQDQASRSGGDWIGPQVVSARGTVLSMQEGEGINQATQVHSGSMIPSGRELWTCPWGGVNGRYSDDTFVSMDRDTLADFAQAGETRQITLKKGLLSVNRWPAKQGRGSMIIKTALGLVTFRDAEVAVLLTKDQAIVEVAHGNVEFKRTTDGKIVKLVMGQYVVIRSDNELLATTGSLKWRVEPSATPGS